MRMPKLKKYFLALSPDQYQVFERTRTLKIEPVTLDIMTGVVRGRPYLYLAATPNIADNIVREHYRYSGAVYILRIPAEYVNRDRLIPAPGATQIWQYDRDLVIDHCGVDCYELAVPTEPL